MAVLGDMLELGPDERDYHVEIGRHAAARGVDVLVTVGPLAAAMADRFDGEVHPVADAADAAALLPELLARPATSCWSRPRAASGSSSCAAALQRGSGMTWLHRVAPVRVTILVGRC